MHEGVPPFRHRQVAPEEEDEVVEEPLLEEDELEEVLPEEELEDEVVEEPLLEEDEELEEELEEGPQIMD